MMRVKMTIEYDGTAYAGWQRQKNQKTVQGEIERALGIILKTPVSIVTAGRTDAGVHARNQIAHCDIEAGDLFRLQKAINGIVNRDIVIKDISRVAADFHARFDARERTYCYRIALKPTAIMRHYSWYFPHTLNKTLLLKAADYFTDVTDFTSFCKLHGSNTTYDCYIKKSVWRQKADFLNYTVTANRFLYGMVRGLVGTMIDLARGRITWMEFTEIVNARDVRRLPAMAPARGLTLEMIKYNLKQEKK